METNWYSPNRLSSFALISSILMFLRRIFSSGWIIFVPLLINFSWQKLGYLLLILLAVAVISIVLGIVYYLNFKFWITDKEIIVNEWFFRLKKVNIPFDRIQSVSLEQSFWQKMLDVYQVKIDTAGSSGDEINLKALDEEVALAFKAFIQEKTSFDITENKAIELDEETQETSKANKAGKTVLQLSIGKLLLVGLTVNHLKSSVYIFLFMFYILQFTERLHLERYAVNQITESGLHFGSLGLWLNLFGVFIAISLVVSVVTTFLKYYNLTLTDFDQYLIASHGLFKTSEVHMRERRIQKFTLIQNPLQALAQFKELRLKQVGADGKSSLNIPGIGSKKAEELFDEYNQNARSYFQSSIPIHGNRKLILGIRFGVLTFAFLGLGLFFKMALINWPLLFIWVFLGYLYWRNSVTYKITLMKTGIEKQAAFFEYKQEFIRYEKIQGLSLSTDPICKIFGYRNLQIYTAGGGLRLAFIPVEKALYLRDYLLYRVEREQKTWM
ncbi:MAG: PH domain-containing protein [Luteibaculaceae bacterium]